jgi:hypothetical protein
MNHNGVISRPSDGTSTFVAGDIVKLNSNGQATPTATGGNAIGVVLQDVKSDETARPIDIQLFSAGGIANINATSAGGAISPGTKVGYANAGKSVVANGANVVGIAMEALVGSDGLIQVILL